MTPPVEDDKFEDIWYTDRIQKTIDKSRVWGTKEYFNRVGKPRDEWDTGFDDDIKRIKQDAERIRKDARKIAANARQAAANARQATRDKIISQPKPDYKSSDSSSTSRSSASRLAPRPTWPITRISANQKKKRRFKLSEKAGGIGIGGILIWSFVLYQCFFSGSDEVDKTSKVKDASTQDSITEKAKNVYNNIKPEAQALIDKAKGEFNKITVINEKTPKVDDSNDQYSQNDDRFESIEDKW